MTHFSPPNGKAGLVGAPFNMSTVVRPNGVSLGHLVASIPTWTDLTDLQRQNHHIGVSTCIRIIARNLGITEASVRSSQCDIPWLNSVLFVTPPKAHNLKQTSFGNYVTSLRTALRRANQIDEELSVALLTDGPWQTLLASVNCTYAVMGLKRFAAWCHARDVMPEDVTTETISAFEAYVSSRMLRADIRQHIGNIAKSWRRLSAKGLISGCTNPSALRRRETYTLPFAAFPVSFQQAVDDLARRLGRTDGLGPFRGEGPIRPLRPRSVQSRIYNIRQAASALVRSGRDVTTIASLNDLVEETAFESILTYFWQRAIDMRKKSGQLRSDVDPPSAAGVTTQTAAIGSALVLVARHYCRVPPEQLARLISMARDLRPPMQTAIHPKVRAILNQLSVSTTRDNLLKLPRTLLKIATGLRTEDPLRGARLAMVALAVEFELNIPLRIGNLAELRLDQHLKRLDPGSNLMSLLSIPAGMVKNELDIELPIDPDLAHMLDDFIVSWRPILEIKSSPWLFPAGHRDSTGPRSVDALRQGITEAIREHVGIHMHVHAFRAFVACLSLEDSSGALDDVRLLLGHKTVETAARYYAYLKPSLAAARYANVLKKARQEGFARICQMPAPAAKTPRTPRANKR